MGKSVLELGVETGKWDAGLKKAKNALDTFVEANGDLDKALDKEGNKIKTFVQMMGNVSSTAKTAKGQMNDYKSTLERLTMQYNQMSDAQKKAVGTEYLQAIEQLKQKYRDVNEEVKKFNQSLSEGGGGQAAMPSTNQFGGALQVFGGNLMTKGFEMATSAAWSFVDSIKQAAAEGIEMAKTGEGIRAAFERINRPDLLDKLREATHGTVADLDLMRQAVKFKDFRLNVDQLGAMLAFAQQKAKDTGQSIDFLVESIVNGLGRQSKLILDNLGISAAEIDEEMKKTGDMTEAVGNIIKKQMSDAGEYVATAADKAAQANAEMKNAMVSLGQTLLPLQEQGAGMWAALEIGAIKALDNGIRPLVPVLIDVKDTIQSIGEFTVAGKSLWDRYTDALANVTMKAVGMLGPLGKVVQLLAYIRGDSGLEDGARAGGGIGAMVAGYETTPKATPSATTTTTTTGGGGKSSSKSSPSYAADSIAAQSALVSELNKQWQNAGAGLRDQYLAQLVLAEAKLKEMKQEQDLLRANLEGKYTNENTDTNAANAIGKNSVGIAGYKNIDAMTEELQNFFDEHPISLTLNASGDGVKETTKDVNAMIESANKVGTVVGSIGQAFSSIEDPSAKVMGTVMQAIASVALGYAQALTMAEEVGGPWGWIAFAATGLATMITTISAIHNATGYAEGGLIPGNSYSGDQMPAMVNSGELILNRAQQGNIASQLQEGGRQPRLVARLKGSDILVSVERTLGSQGKGQLMTFK